MNQLCYRMSTKDGVKEILAMREDGWIYAGGNFDHHTAYHDIFCRDWGTCMPDIPDRGVFYNDSDDLQEFPLTNCVCGETIKRWIFIYQPNGGQWEWIGSECRKIMENRKMCGGCKDNFHNNRKDNRCTECRDKEKEKKKLICPKCGGKKGIQYRKCYGCRAPKTGWHSY